MNRNIAGIFRDRAPAAILAAIVASPFYVLLAFWFSFGQVNMATAYFYFSLIPVLAGLGILSAVQGRGQNPRLTRGKVARFALYALLPYTLYDWARVPFNYFLGLPFWDHWFDWGASTTGSLALFSYQSLTAGMIGHILRGWGMAFAFYLLTKTVTLLKAFIFAWAMTFFYWSFFPYFVLTDAAPPFIWWFVAWLSHMVFAVGLWYAPKLFSNY